MNKLTVPYAQRAVRDGTAIKTTRTILLNLRPYTRSSLSQLFIRVADQVKKSIDLFIRGRTQSFATLMSNITKILRAAPGLSAAPGKWIKIDPSTPSSNNSHSAPFITILLYNSCCWVRTNMLMACFLIHVTYSGFMWKFRS